MIRVLLVSPTRLYRDALAAALEATGRLTIVDSLDDADKALASVRELDPDVMLVDLPMSQVYRLILSLQQARAGTRVIAFAVPRTESDIMGWAEAGVWGCLTQETPLEDLPSFVEAVQRGEIACSNGAAGLLFRHARAIVTTAVRDRSEARLTHREIQVLHLLAAGLSNKEISRKLSIQVATVKNHVHSIFTKLRIRDRSEAAAWAHAGGRVEGRADRLLPLIESPR
jgi:two-component system, NarL family, nitrate/nitrite response regulator NarL